MQIDFDARLAASTVIVDGREWCQGTLTNLATNPSFEAAGSTVEVRRNLCGNPVPRVNTSGWTEVRGTLTRSGLSNLEDFRFVFQPTSSGALPSVAQYNLGYPHASAKVTVTVERDMSSEVVPIYLAIAQGSVLGFVESTDARVSVSVDLPNTEALAQVRVGVPLSSGLSPIGFNRVLIEYSPVSSSYFDGDYSPDPDLVPSWTGSVNGSASILSGTRPAQVIAPAAGQGQTYQTGDGPVTGSKAQRFLCLTASPAGIPCMQSGSVATGTLYTMVMWVRASRGIIVHPRIKGVTSGVDATTLQPGVWTLVRTTVTAGSGSDAQTGLLLDGNSGHQIGDTIDIDDVTIVQGEHPYLVPFHGGTVNPDWPGVTYAWTGTPNASTSTRTTPAIDRIEVDRDPGTGWVPVRGGRRDVINGFVALTDHEMPLHQEVRYRVAGYSGATYVGAFTGTVDTSIPAWCGVFVKIPANPNATVMVDPTNTIDIDSSTQGGSYDIAAGSSIAVAAWSGVNASRFTLNALTKTDVDSAQMRALLQKNRVILLQGPDWEPFPPGWYYVESVSEGLRGDGAIKQGRKWSLSLVSTGVPSGDTAGVAGASWNQIRAKYATWDELKTANDTWFDVLQGGN